MGLESSFIKLPGSKLALVLTLALLGRPLSAQTEAENRAAARTLAIEGVKAAEAGDCTKAIDLFTRAEQLFHAPTILLGLGECQCKQGLLVEGTENLNKVARENLGENPPEAFVEAQQKAGELLTEYLPKVAKLTLVVETPGDAPYQTRVDGAALPAAMVGVARPINPGTHEIVVDGDAYLPSRAEVTLAEGETQTTTIQLELAPVAEAPQQSLPAEPVDAGPASSEPDRLPAYIAFGVGGAGLALGTVFGLSASSTKSDLEKVCIDGRCPPSADGDIDSMQTNATLATASFGVGLVAIGVGAYLWFTAEPGSGSAASPRENGLSVRAFVSPNEIGINGVF